MNREVRFEARGAQHVLRFTYRAFYLLDAEHGHTVTALWRGLTQLSIKTLAATLVCGLEGARLHAQDGHKPYTLDDALGILEDLGHRRVSELVAEAVNLGLGDPKGETPDGTAKAPNAT